MSSNSPLNGNMGVSVLRSKQYVTQGGQKSRSISPNIGQTIQQPVSRQVSNNPIFPNQQQKQNDYSQDQIFYQQQQNQQPQNLLNHSSQFSQISQQGAYLYIPCPSHPDLFITNICKSRECIEPLCPECITSHLEMHQRNGGMVKVENIQRVRKECLMSIQQQIDKLQKDSNELRQHSIGQQQVQYQNCIEAMNIQHKNLQNMIDDYFEQMQKELKEKMRGLEELKNQYQQLENLVQDDIKQLEGIANELQGQNFVRFVIRQLEEEQNNVVKKKTQDLEHAIQKYEEQLPIIQVDQQAYDHIRYEIQHYCYITTKKQYQKLSSQNNNNNNNNNYNNTNKIQKRTYGSQVQSELTLPKQNILSHIPESEIQTLDERTEYNIDSEDHLKNMEDRNRMITCFEEDTKKLHLMYLYDPEQKIQTLNLQIDFRIPMNHRSFTCSNGTTLITGGVYRERNRFKASDQVFKLDLDDMTLKPCQPMNYARAMHQICEIGKFLFVVGGTQTNDENSSINKCEKYEINTGKWTPFSDCKYKSSGSSLTHINHKYLVKIGGKLDIFTPCSNIEIYEIDQDYCGAGSLRLPFNACALTINQRDILIFGGSIHDVKSNETQDSIKNQAHINVSRALPRAIEFTTQSAFIDSKHIYVFEDVGGKKKVLNGNSKGWNEL